MDKYEYSIKAEKIKKLAERKDYETAAKIADGIDWERIRNVKMLTVVSQVYEKLERYEDARDILLRAYGRAPVGRRFLYKLTELAVKQGEFAEAEEYLKEFAATSPQDPSRLILRYEIARAKGASPEQLITILEAYQKREFEEKWSYELASLYYRAGKQEECIKLCDELILWFGVGPYVDKALELKQKIAPLTPEQMEKKENKEKYLRRLEDIQKEAEAEEAREEEREKKERKIEAAGLPPSQESQPEEGEGQLREAQEAQNVPEPDSEPQSQTQTPRVSAYAEEGRRQAEFERSLAREIEAAIARREARTNREIKEPSQEKPAEAGTGAGETGREETSREEIRQDEIRQEETGREEVGQEETGREEIRQEETGPELQIPAEPAQAKTKTFVFESRAIDEALQESQDGMVDAEAVERRANQLMQEAMRQNPKAEEAQPIKAQAATEAQPSEELTKEQHEEAAEAAANDHYVLVACEDEETGLHECVSYIRRMREQLGHPAAQAAKIRGEKLISKDLVKTFRKLAGRDLIVVGTAGVPDSVLAEVIDRAQTDQKDSFVALIDTKLQIDGLRERVPFFAGCRFLSCADDNAGTAETAAAEAAEAQTEAADMPAEEKPQEHRTLAELVEEALRAGGLESLKSQTAVQESGEQRETRTNRQPAEGAELSEQPTVPEEADLSGEVGLSREQPDEQTQQERQEQTQQEQELKLEPAPDPELKLEPAPEPRLQPGERERSKSHAKIKGKAKEKDKVKEAAFLQAADEKSSGKRTSGGMTAKEFFDFAEEYAQMLDATIDDLGGLAVFAVAEQYQQERVPLTEELAQELVEKAILRAERRSFKSLFSNRYNKEGYLILKEEHFKE